MAEFLEIVMVVSFGASWPLNVMKSFRARTTKGKSLPFLLLIFFGYIAGLASKVFCYVDPAKDNPHWYVVFFYVLNLIMVGVDLILYVRNYRLDKKALAASTAQTVAVTEETVTAEEKPQAEAPAAEVQESAEDAPKNE